MSQLSKYIVLADENEGLLTTKASDRHQIPFASLRAPSLTVQLTTNGPATTRGSYGHLPKLFSV